MLTYSVELPVDLDTFRFWFRAIFEVSLWSTALDTITVLSSKDDEVSRRLAAYEEQYIINRSAVSVAYIHCRAFRKDKLRVQAVQYLPWAESSDERKETFRDVGGELVPVWAGGNERYILDGLKDWFGFMYGADQVREIKEENVQIATRVAQVLGDQIYWSDVHSQAPASGNISEYLEKRGISRSTYYDNVKRFGLDRKGK